MDMLGHLKEVLQATSSTHFPNSTGKQNTSFDPTTALSECFQDFTALALEIYFLHFQGKFILR